MNISITEKLNISLSRGSQYYSERSVQKKREVISNGCYQKSNQLFYSGILFPLMNRLNLLNLAIVIAMGAWMIISGQVSAAIGLGLIVTFVEYSQTYFELITQVTSIYSMIQLALTGARRLAEVEEQSDEDAVPNGKKIGSLQTALKLENVHFGYNKDKEILHGVNIILCIKASRSP